MQMPDAGGGCFSILTAVDRASSRYNGGYSPEARGGAVAGQRAARVLELVEDLQGSRLLASARFLQP